MAEFKTICPNCGQRVQCDAAWAGQSIPCPSCQQTFLVGTAPVESAATLPSPGRTGKIAGAVLLALLIMAGVWLVFLRESRQPGNHRHVVSAPPVERHSDALWTLNLERFNTPSEPASGWIHGSRFRMEQSLIDGDSLIIRNGTGSHPETEIQVVLLLEENDSVSDKAYFIGPNEGRGVPQIWVRWQNDQPPPLRSRLYVSGYAMNLQFGKVKDGRVSGTIHLCLPDDLKSYVAGAFTALAE